MAAPLQGRLDAMDYLAGCTRRSIIAVEAMWQDTFLLMWRETYDVGVARYGHGTPELLAFLEGCMAVQSLATFRGDGTL